MIVTSFKNICKLYQYWFGSWYMTSNPTFIPLISSSFDLGIIILTSDYSNSEIPSLWGLSTVFRAPLNWGRQITECLQGSQAERMFVLFCDFYLSFIPSPTALTSFLTSKCILVSWEVFSLWFTSQHFHPPTTTSVQVRLLGQACLWCHSPLSHNAGKNLRDLVVSQRNEVICFGSRCSRTPISGPKTSCFLQ